MDRKRIIEQNLKYLREKINEAATLAGRDSDDIKLVAVSKNFPVSDLQIAYELGQRSFGENRVQELTAKVVEVANLDLKPDWHLIGTLQRNKVRFVVGQVSLIHSIDSIRLIKTVERLAAREEIIQDVLLQVNISGELTKQGFDADEARDILLRCQEFPHVRVRGLMTMAPHYEDPEQTIPVFRALRELRDGFIEQGIASDLPELSMGMTNDFAQAIREGATIVRIGSAIFGDRVYG